MRTKFVVRNSNLGGLLFPVFLQQRQAEKDHPGGKVDKNVLDPGSHGHLEFERVSLFR